MEIDEDGVRELMEGISKKTRDAIKDHVKKEIEPLIEPLSAAIETQGIEIRKFSVDPPATPGIPIHWAGSFKHKKVPSSHWQMVNGVP